MIVRILGMASPYQTAKGHHPDATAGRLRVLDRAGAELHLNGSRQ
jgi:hypothetical protein